MIDYAVSDLIKHRGGMLLIDRLISYTDDSVIVEADITRKNLFFEENKGVPAWIGIEYAAQGVACFAGVRTRLNNLQPRIGFLLNCRRYHCNVSYFPQGSCLIISAKEELSDGQMGSYQCELALRLADGCTETVAQLSINAYSPENMVEGL